MDSLIVLVHVCFAMLGLLSGFMAMAFRKGSGLHGAAGTIFFGSMICMSSSAVYIALFLRPNFGNAFAGLLTLYLISTAWVAGTRRQGGTNLFDKVALVYAIGVVAGEYTLGFVAANSPGGKSGGVPAPVFFVFGTITLLCAVSDVRMLIRGGVVGSKRIARHLWRMSLALLIATLSFYPGQARLFPRWLRQTNLLFIPLVLLLGMMFFWLYRVSVRKRVPINRVVGRARPDAVVTVSVGIAEPV